MFPENLKVRRPTLDRRAMWTGAIGLIVSVSFLLSAWTKPSMAPYQPAIIACLASYVAFQQALIAAASKRRTELHAVEEFRPYLIVVREGEQLLVENVGRGLAFRSVIYTGNAAVPMKVLGTLRPQERHVLSDEIAGLVKSHGIQMVYKCQFGRKWGASVDPQELGFATQFVEFDQPENQTREF